MNPPRQPVVRLHQAGLAYPGPPPVEALRPSNLTIDSGEYVAVVGSSGSGKSTLLNVLGLLDRPTTGSYALDGLDTVTLPERERAALRGRRIGFVFQSFHLLPYRTATENVALAMLYQAIPVKQRLTRAREALDRVGLTHRAAALPSHMSGGEQQRVAIARSVVNKPSLLLCDEPTGNLDSNTAHAVLDLIGILSTGGTTVIVVTHDPTVAARAHRKIEMNDGSIHESAVATSRAGA